MSSSTLPNGEMLSRFSPPLRGGANPGATLNVTTPGSFANAPDIGGPLMFSSPDTPGMPQPSAKTAWDFMPDGWLVEVLSTDPSLDASSVKPCASSPCTACEIGRASC